jgi:hypothetical protein
VLPDDPERGRKRDIRPKENKSSVDMRGSFADCKEGELGKELEERVREEREGLHELGKDAEWVEEESARRRKEKGRRSFKFEFRVFLEGVLGDRRIVGVERTLERVESGETEGERAGKSSGAGIGCVAGFVSGFVSVSDEGS